MDTSSTDPSRPDPERTPFRWRLWAGLGLGVLLGVAFLARPGKGGEKAGRGGGRPVPVLVVAAHTGDMPLTLTGLGTVTPVTTVTVRSRVDGQLVRVAFTEGQQVAQGQLLAEIDPRPFQVQLMQAEGQLAKDQAAAKNAAMDLARFRDLARQGILAQQQLDAQTSLVSQSEAALRADQAQVASARLNLTYSRITAPIAGRVGLRLVDPGNMVHASDPNGLAVVAAVKPIDVVFTIPADSIQRVLGQSRRGARLPVEAFDRDMNRRLALGRLEAIDNQVDPATGTVKLKARFANDDGALFPNQFVNARLRVDTLTGVVLVPTAALQQGPQGSYVYVVRADHTVEMRPVVVQATEGDDTALKAGVKAGEAVVTDGLEKLRQGSQVSIAKPDAPDKGQGKP